jgi:hypothetical protein
MFDLIPAEPACHEELIFYEDVPQEDLLAAAKSVLGRLRWKWSQESPERIVARVPISWRSWGEKFTVRAYPREVQVRSECAFQLFDWGKNEDNVRLFLKRLDDTLDVEPCPTLRPPP